VTKATAENPAVTLKELVFRDKLNSFQKDFLIETGVVIEFTQESKEELKNWEDAGEDISLKLKEQFKDFSYGLKLIKAEKLTVNKEVLINPAEYLNRLIKKSYAGKKQ
jgi:hypothetical protein